MAIITPAGGAPLRAVTGTTMLSVGGQDQPVATTATNNRKRKKGRVYRGGVSSMPGFQGMDALILNLDAIYDTLGNHAAWNLLAIEMDGQWGLCANCMPDSGAKKLYRQINFNNFLIGQPRDDTPPAAPAFHVDPAFSFAIDTLGNGFFLSGEINAAQWWVAKVGQQLANPKVHVVPADLLSLHHLGDPLFDWMVANFTSGPQYVCSFLDNGVPGQVELGELFYF